MSLGAVGRPPYMGYGGPPPGPPGGANYHPPQPPFGGYRPPQ
jgi:hypothetical protein